MAYFGPADKARQYFIDMGYEPANRQTTADFLVAVTDPNGRIPRAGVSSLPRNATEFEAYFKQSAAGHANREEMDAYSAEFVGVPDRAKAYAEHVRAERPKHSDKGSPYTVSIPMQVRAVMLRRVQILKGNMVTQFINLLSVQAFDSRYIFVFVLKLKFGVKLIYIPGNHHGNSLLEGSRLDLRVFLARRCPVLVRWYHIYCSLCWTDVSFNSALLFSALATMAEIPALYAQRPIVDRHQKAALYHPFVEARE